MLMSERLLEGGSCLGPGGRLALGKPQEPEHEAIGGRPLDGVRPGATCGVVCSAGDATVVVSGWSSVVLMAAWNGTWLATAAATSAGESTSTAAPALASSVGRSEAPGDADAVDAVVQRALDVVVPVADHDHMVSPSAGGTVPSSPSTPSSRRA